MKLSTLHVTAYHSENVNLEFFLILGTLGFKIRLFVWIEDIWWTIYLERLKWQWSSDL